MSRRQIPVGLAAGLGAAALSASGEPAAAAETDKQPGLVHTADAIHQSVTFAAPPDRVYAVLTSAEAFQKVVELGEAFKTMPAGKPKATISPDVGGAFSLFGGYIVGRHLDLKPGERLVQAWREVIWDPGQFSLVSFHLAAHPGGAALTFDHTGFPDGAGPHLSIGWYRDYWWPLAKYLAGA
jgi:activator of HSP90 ATPase